MKQLDAKNIEDAVGQLVGEVRRRYDSAPLRHSAAVVVTMVGLGLMMPQIVTPTPDPIVGLVGFLLVVGSCWGVWLIPAPVPPRVNVYTQLEWKALDAAAAMKRQALAYEVFGRSLGRALDRAVLTEVDRIQWDWPDFSPCPQRPWDREVD